MEKFSVYRSDDGGDFPWFVQEPNDECWTFSTHAEAVEFAQGRAGNLAGR